MNFTQLFFAEVCDGWIFGGSAGVFFRVILRRRRGANGRFCRGIPGFLVCARVRRGDSVHGGHGQGDWAKKFFKNLLERGEKPKNGGARGAGRWSGRTSYRVCGVIFRRDF